jgi:hypothetical protein
MLTLLGVVSALRGANLTGASFVIALGAPALLIGGRRTFAEPLRLRATSDGVWFGGGSVIPWRDIKGIFEARMNVRVDGVRARTSSIAFEFQRRATLLRTPLTCWLAAPFAVGDVDVSPSDSSQRASVLASRLEAMRVVAVGHEDAVSVGASELPAARVISRDD